MAITSHLFPENNIASNYLIETRNKILIHYRIAEFEKNLEFLRVFHFFLIVSEGSFCFVTSFISGRSLKIIWHFILLRHNQNM